MNRFFLIILLALGTLVTSAQQAAYSTEDNINYYPESDQKADVYIQERCVLDLYHHPLHSTKRMPT